MNKYQRAYSLINGEVIFHSLALDDDERYKEKMEALGILNELAEKATPKNPLGISLTHDGRVGNCPYCHKLIRENDSKPNICECGQRLDWSD